MGLFLPDIFNSPVLEWNHRVFDRKNLIFRALYINWLET